MEYNSYKSLWYAALISLFNLCVLLIFLASYVCMLYMSLWSIHALYILIYDRNGDTTGLIRLQHSLVTNVLDKHNNNNNKTNTT